jgi:hypothetical protein
MCIGFIMIAAAGAQLRLGDSLKFSMVYTFTVNVQSGSSRLSAYY